MNHIPTYELSVFRPVHREEGDYVPFGSNGSQPVPGFELYSSQGLKRSPMGPLKSAFYRVSLTVNGSLDMQIGLDHYVHQPRTLSFTYPNQIFSKSNASADAWGYYALFTEDFLSEFVPTLRMPEEFPFFDPYGQPLFQPSQEEMDVIIGHILRIDDEMRSSSSGRVRAIRMHLYLLLHEARRSYERQGLSAVPSTDLVTRFRRLVSRHCMDKRHVSDYASLLSVTPNHLGRVVRSQSGRTPSDFIRDMLLIEAKSLLRYTSKSVSEIAYELGFEPATFGRFFRQSAGMTPLEFRGMQD
ncbi:MAG TPA: helix-turn-helix transcriptional regulator [Dinghuibacter sp.]|uniref:helix-turn-helix domain-containing protein n=1 Tax=Dinghuibacter sp. TaxID=2024697 RepID=UPI002C4504D9|nr:helix-turn-helix transcriptional regulator [Dinghuibacter sp.]HTJ10619.1 helix-turn-helix transcriptional regulator [Dinghuibacter sp.]